MFPFCAVPLLVLAFFAEFRIFLAILAMVLLPIMSGFLVILFLFASFFVILMFVFLFVVVAFVALLKLVKCLVTLSMKLRLIEE